MSDVKTSCNNQATRSLAITRFCSSMELLSIFQLVKPTLHDLLHSLPTTKRQTDKVRDQLVKQ